MYTTTTCRKCKKQVHFNIFCETNEKVIPPENNDLWVDYYSVEQLDSYFLGIIFRERLENRLYENGVRDVRFKKIYISNNDEVIQILARTVGGKNETKRCRNKEKYRFFLYIDKFVDKFKIEEALILFGHNFQEKQFNGCFKDNGVLFSFMKEWIQKQFIEMNFNFHEELFNNGLKGYPPDYKIVNIKEEELFTYETYLKSLEKNNVKVCNLGKDKVKVSDLKPFIDKSRKELIYAYNNISIYNNKDNKDFKKIPIMRGIYNKSFPYDNLLFSIEESLIRIQDDGNITEDRKNPNFSITWRVALDQDFVPLYDKNDKHLCFIEPIIKEKFIHQQDRRLDKFKKESNKKYDKVLANAKISRDAIDIINSRMYKDSMESYDCFRSYLEHLYGYRYLESLGFNPNFQSNLCYILTIYKEDLDKFKTYNEKFRYLIDNNLMSKEELLYSLKNIFEELECQSKDDTSKQKNILKMKKDISVVKL
jgi:hypothetical protein